MDKSNEAERERERGRDKKVCDGRNKSTNASLRLSFYYQLSSERFVRFFIKETIIHIRNIIILIINFNVILFGKDLFLILFWICKEISFFYYLVSCDY